MYPNISESSWIELNKTIYSLLHIKPLFDRHNGSSDEETATFEEYGTAEGTEAAEGDGISGRIASRE